MADTEVLKGRCFSQWWWTMEWTRKPEMPIWENDPFNPHRKNEDLLQAQFYDIEPIGWWMELFLNYYKPLDVIYINFYISNTQNNPDAI